MTGEVHANTPMRGRVDIVQLEITYRCQLRCPRCNRHCNLDGLDYLRDADLTLEQLDRFIGQVRSAGVHLRQLRVLGGEPLLHPLVNDIVVRLVEGLMVAGSADTMVIVTNGLIPVHERLDAAIAEPRVGSMLSDGRIDLQVAWPGKEDSFRGVLVSPADMGMPWQECSAPRGCGSCFNTYGYWPNGSCGAVARLFDMREYARFQFPVVFEEAWPRLESEVCRHCVKGNRVLLHNQSDAVTPSYQEAMARWKSGSRAPLQRF